ncbi:MAG: hypothetical protein H6718_22355 [Polyangiaceae bacterium]|nr:hypothetical protein [Myxococcales bacterium]MCB9588167.1 hypothetical protein [Polyangiaceae bacterium]
MQRRIVSALAALAVTSTVGLASAEEGGFGAEGNFVFSAERLFGFSNDKFSFDTPNDDERTFKGFGFGWSGGRSTPYNTPRLGLDYFINDNLSIGGAFGYASLDISDDANDPSGFILAPRVGYMIGISDVFGFWPRGGLTYYTFDDPDFDQVGLTLEGLFSIAPRPGFGFITGVVLDLGFSGSQDFGQTSVDYTDRNIALVFGIAGSL